MICEAERRDAMLKLRYESEPIIQTIEEERVSARWVSMVYALVRFELASFSALGDRL